MIHINDTCQLCHTLRFYKQIGVDSEYHSKYAFVGLTCLIQISWQYIE